LVKTAVFDVVVPLLLVVQPGSLPAEVPAVVHRSTHLALAAGAVGTMMSPML